MSAVEKLLAEWERAYPDPENVMHKPGRWFAAQLRAAIEADRETHTPSVDWLDPARESCLIDGVRYTRVDSGARGKTTIRGWATWVDDDNWLFEVTDDPNGNQDPATLLLEPDTWDEAAAAARGYPMYAFDGRDEPWREVRVERRRLFVDDSLAWVEAEHGSETILVPTASPEPDKETP